MERPAHGAQRARVLREPAPQVLLELGEEPEVLEPRAVGEDEAEPLRERRLAPEGRAPLLADLLRGRLRPEPVERVGERGDVEAEPDRRLREDAARGAQRVEELVLLAPRERAAEVVVLEEPGEFRVARRAASGRAPRRERVHERLPPGAVLSEEPLEHGAPLREEQLLDERRGR